MRSKNKIFFLTKTIQTNTESFYSNKIDIILSPELYWVRIFDIPINSEKEALKVVPTFFEDFLDIDIYQFYSIKLQDNKYLCFAYNEKEILNSIKNANINLNKVNSIAFAQNEFMSFFENELNGFKINDEYFAYQDNVLVKFPKEFITSDDFIDCDISKLKLSKYKIPKISNSKYIDNKSIYTLSIVCILVALINFAKVYNIDKTINSTLKNQEHIKQKYNMLPTLLQTKSVIKTLEKTMDKQVKLRDTLKNTLKNKNMKRLYFKNGKVGYE